MSLLLPSGLLALALAVPVVVLHMLTPRRPPTQVSSLLHWDGLRHSITAAEPWQRLRWSLLLVLQLAIVALLALALARPATVEEAELAEHTVFVVDASGSMAALDGEPDRAEAAAAEAKALRAEIPDGGLASLVVAGPSPTVLVDKSDDPEEFSRAVDTIRVSPGAAGFEAAFALAESLVSADRSDGFVLISDGQLTEIEQRLAPLGTRYVPVGEADINRAVTDLSVTAGPGGLQARVAVESTGGPDAAQVLRLDVDGITVLSLDIEIPSGGVVEETFELPTGTRVAAFLDGEDLLAADNQRYAGAPVLGELRARVHGETTFFVDQLLSAIPEVDVVTGLDEEADFDIFAGVAVPTSPERPFIALDAPGGAPGVTPAGRVTDPVPTLVSDHPVLDGIDVSRIAIADAQSLRVESGEVILGAPGAPLIVSGNADGVPFFYIAFSLEQSNLPIDVAYPIMGARMVGALASSHGVADSMVVGEPLPVGRAGGTVIDPRGERIVLSAGDSPPLADQAGFWIVEPAGGERAEVAVNPDTRESDLAPVGSLPELRPGSPEEAPGTGTIARSLLPWAIGALLALLALELWVASRARGVTSRQWRWGLAVRVAIVTLLVLALVDPVFQRSSDEVTTVFVVDVSDSMGDSAREAQAWVESALTDGGDARWGVVEFGGDARVGTPLGNEPYLRARGIERDSTNVSRGLRLGESVLTGETRQRLVLVSDGRSNSGDLQAELDRLETLGVVVDVHILGGDEKADAAIAGIDLPGRVNEGEEFEATVEVLSTISGEATVELVDDAGVVEEKLVTLEPGPNYVSFRVGAAAAGSQQLEARVRMPGDDEHRNDSATSAVEVRGPASVLVVEADEGEADPLVGALEARGLVVQRTPPDGMPGIQELSIHRAVVLVDVPVGDLDDNQLAALDSYVRDLGRGMVTVGGTDSHGLGGYRDTTLEALLPVDSEATDAQRESSVAEVLLIDTSESMGACHCSEDNVERPMGGVNKTDISKAAAVRAVDALGENDEIGLLAFSGTNEWVIPLQQLPDRSTVEEGVSSLRPFGETRIVPALDQAAEALRESSKELKHIILFTDGFTSELDLGPEFEFGRPPFIGDLVEEVEALAAEGITVSVVGTGEGAIPALEEVAEAGKGRFYPGRDLDEIPEIFVKEARLASRSYINEGEFFPAVTSTAEAVRDLASSPALLGYIATTAKPTADVQLQIGEFSDPLLASWRVGLGKVTSWTSDAGDRWAAQWSGWEGFEDFWSDVVRDTFPLEGSEGQSAEASIADEVLTVTVESSEAWPAGSDPVARLSLPGGASEEIRLERVSDFEFEATVPAREGGTYAVGVSVERADGQTVVLSALATRSFAAEYLPGEPDPDLMRSISTSTGGRGEITAAQAFDPEGLEPGVTERTYRWWYLLVAALLWPADVALRRLRLSRGSQPPRQPREGRPRTTPRRPEGAQTR